MIEHRNSLYKPRAKCRLGKYTLKKKLGSGSYCQVWKAFDNIQKIDVALKIPLSREAKSDSHQKLFNEINVLSTLAHPNIITIKNADIIDGLPIISMELYQKCLEECQRPMGLARLYRIIAQVLDALAYLHKNKILHCDVSPTNIFLCSKDKVVLGDFGNACKFKKRRDLSDDYGTPGYVAPEQAYGLPTYSSDCFGIAIIMYEFIAGALPQWPFNWPLPGLSRFQSRTDRKMSDLIKKAFQIKSSMRFQDAGEMLNAFLEVIPEDIKKTVQPLANPKDWKALRTKSFIALYENILGDFFACPKCGQPVSEKMSFCLWCGNDHIVNKHTKFPLTCPDCEKGILPEWKYCPWCYGVGFKSSTTKITKGFKYHDCCEHCEKGIMAFMKYCPWCHHKIKHKWKATHLPHKCKKCHWPIDHNYGKYCPWCGNAN